MKQFLITVALAFFLYGCAHQGEKFIAPDQYSDFKRGITTYNDVVKRLGEPIGRTNLSSGNYTITYSQGEASTDPMAMVPFVGPFIAKSTMTVRAQNLTFTFDKKNRLVDYQDVIEGTKVGVR